MPLNQIAPMALKISEACAASRCGRTAIYQALRRGELRGMKRGKSTLILETDLRQWLEGLPTITPIEQTGKAASKLLGNVSKATTR